MASSTAPNPPQSSLSALAGAARGLFVGLVWAALMLIVLSFWTRSKFDTLSGKIFANAFLIAGALALGLAIWQAITLWLQKETPEAKVATLGKQRRILGAVLLIGGLALIVCAFWFGFGKDPSGVFGFLRDNLAESVGVLLFGFLALAGGYALTQPPLSEAESSVTMLMEKRPFLKLVQIVLCVGAIIGLIAIGWTSRGMTGTITDCTSGTPIVVTSTAHGLATGASIKITNVGGVKLANGAWKITKVDANRFSLDGSFGDGISVFSGGGGWEQPHAYVRWIPEFATLLFLSILCLACFLWLATSEFDEFGMRVFVLVFGGSLGFLLFAYALARAIVWRQDFIGGIPALQGENGWHVWLCIYLHFIALILMFVSFRIARTDIRQNVYLRRTLFGYDTLVQVALLFEVLAVIVYVVYSLYPFTYDWTKARGAYALSDSTKNLVGNLKQEVNVVVLVSQNHPIYKDLHTLLDNCQSINASKLKVTYFSPDSNQLEYERLAKLFPKILPDGRGVLLVKGKIPEKLEKDDAAAPVYSFIPDQKLHKFERAPRPGEKGAKHTFFGEAEIFKELKFLVQDKQKRKIYVLQGESTADINNKERRDRSDFRDSFANVGIALVIDQLRMDNYDIVGLTFNKELGPKQPNMVVAMEEGADKKKSIPADCQTLIIPGASKRFSAETLDAIERYLEQRRGTMLVFLDVVVEDDYSKMKDTGLEAILKRYGVEVTDEYPLRMPITPLPDARLLIATTPKASDNALARQFAGKVILMQRSARVVRPVEMPGRFRTETVLQCEFDNDRDLAYTLEKNVSILRDPQRHMVDIAKDPVKQRISIQEKPIPVAVAVTETEGEKPRLVVFGDTEFITNFELARSPTRGTHYSLIVGSLEWMGERESIGALPKENTNFVLQLAEVNYWRMILLPTWLMFLAIVGLGIGIWIVRRR